MPEGNCHRRVRPSQAARVPRAPGGSRNDAAGREGALRR